MPVHTLCSQGVVSDVAFSGLPRIPSVGLSQRRFSVVTRVMGRQQRSFLLRFSVHGRFGLKPVGCRGIITSVQNDGCPSRRIVIYKRLSTFSANANNVSYNAKVTPVVRTTHVLTLSKTGPGEAVLFVTFTKRRFKLLNSGTCYGGRRRRLPGVIGMFGHSNKPRPPIKVTISRTVCSSFIGVARPVRGVQTSVPFGMAIQPPHGLPGITNNASSRMFTACNIPACKFAAGSIGKCGFGCKRV